MLHTISRRVALLFAFGTAFALACGGSVQQTDAGVASDAGGGNDATVADGGSAEASVDAAIPSVTACTTANDCEWGEIDHEILTYSDCICLFGCPHLPQNKATVQRRGTQYLNLCDRDKDGHGNPCPVDDCAEMPPLQCLSGTCVLPD